VNQPKFIVAQLGARMHYAVPRILHEARMLDAFYTDTCATQGILRGLNLIPRGIRSGGLERLLARRPEGLSNRFIHSFPLLGLEYKRRLAAARTSEDAMNANLWVGRQFGRRVLKSAGNSWTDAYVFNSAGLQILEFCRAHGRRGLLEQCSTPRLRELGILREEALCHPEWGNPPNVTAGDSDYAAVEKQEWAAATRIICPSEFVRNALLKEGADAGKIRVVPYGVNVPTPQSDAGDRRPLEALRVLVAGKVCLQKGSRDVYEAAKLLGNRVQIRMVGSLAGLPGRVLGCLRSKIEVLGPVPRPTMPKHYSWADVFLLPSLCEGSATVTYEAMAHGLPVICTPNTGSVVRDAVDGFIVPIRDAAAIAARLEKLAADPPLRRRMGVNARERAGDFTVAAYGRRLLAAIA
jgi:glycosyltransferase involved in cell wall biosynthesis